MDWYNTIKWLHILGLTVLFGAGRREGGGRRGWQCGDRRLGVYHASGDSSANHRHYAGLSHGYFPHRTMAAAGVCALYARLYRMGAGGLASAPHPRSCRHLCGQWRAALCEIPSLLSAAGFGSRLAGQHLSRSLESFG